MTVPRRKTHPDGVLACALRQRAPMGRWPHDESSVARFLDTDVATGGEYFHRMMLSLPEAWWPRTDQAGYDARVFALSCAHLAELVGHYDFLAGCKGRWDTYFARFQARPGRSLFQDGEGAVDMVTAFETQVVDQALRRLDIHDGPIVHPMNTRLSQCVAARILVGSKELQAILDLTDTWHDAHERIEALLAPAYPDRYRWPAPFPDLVVPWEGLPEGNVLTVVGLTTPVALRDEGSRHARDGFQGLAHCVGSYGRRCAAGQSCILSVRLDLDGGPVRLSTMEVSFDPEGAMTVVQHRGRANADPGGVAKMAEAWLVEAHAAGEVATTEAFRAHAWPTNEELDRFGYDWSDGGAFAQAVAAWAPLLPRPLRSPRALERAVAAEAYAVVRARFPQGTGALRHGFLPPRIVPDWGEHPTRSAGIGSETAYARLFGAPSLARRLVRAMLPPAMRRGHLPGIVEFSVTLSLAGTAVAAFLTALALGDGTWSGSGPVGLCCAIAAYAGSNLVALAFLRRIGLALGRDLGVPGR